MHIGITVHFQYSFFSAGSPQTALSIAELFRIKGHNVVFISTGDSKNTWWDDVKGIEKDWKSYKAAELEGKNLDVVFEVGQHLLTEGQRKMVGKSVWLCRKNPIFHDTEASLYPITPSKRDLSGISEIWLFDELVTEDDIQYLELLHRIPVKTIPYLWTPSAIEIQRRDTNAPVWQQVYGMEEFKHKPWSIHICETNTSSSSSCTIPLCIMREIKKSSACFIDPIVKIHNAEHVKMSDFFKGNVLDHCFSDLKDIRPEFLGRQRILDIVYDAKSILIAHSRFIFIKPYILDALWVGIPILHNCEEIAKLGLTEGFYNDNEISKAVQQYESIVLNRSTNIEELKKIRQVLVERFSPYGKKNQEEWNSKLESIGNSPLQKSGEPMNLQKSVEPQKSVEKEIQVGFCDMWDSFNPDYNQFTLLLEASGVCKIKGVNIENQERGKENVDIVVFGPFGDRWRYVKEGIPLVHFTGENTEPIDETPVKLNLGFKHGTQIDMNYLRLPLWMLEINWFRGDVDRIQNPKPISIDRCCKVYEEELERKKKFCAFVVTNPRQPMRNNAFHWLSEYKSVDSAGRLFNNVGDSIFAGLGGGGGEIKKLEFLKDYKFCLTFENDSEDGYTTEKYLHAKAAGCVPIYWGDPKFERDFELGGCIDARGVLTKSELIELVKEIDTNDEAWKKKFRVPALDEVKRDLVRRTLSECANRMLKLCGFSDVELSKIPRFLGYTTDSDISKQSKPLVITCTNKKFLPSLQIFLDSFKGREKEMSCRVYLMNDISNTEEDEYKEQYRNVKFSRIPTESPPSFPDLWEPGHFAWKLWILKEVVNEKQLEGVPVLYLDAGAMICRWPEEWYFEICREGISVLEDPRQENRRWCHKPFCSRLSVTEKELDEKQIWAGCIGFVGGSKKAKEVFEEAWILGQQREVIVGPKWEGQLPDGKPYGHRHDQSILSILSSRHGVKRYELDKVYCDVSLRHTYMKNRSIYAHRGFFRVHDQVATGIDDVFLINLDRREDRLERFKKTHPDLAERIFRLKAIDSKKLRLTRKIARLFLPHDFKWKKAVMGCALSHLSVWMQLLMDKPEVNSYFILEDDVRLNPGWRSVWEDAKRTDSIPEDFDVLYFGGILPPNKEAFEAMGVEKVNSYVGRVKENFIFGQNPPNRYFHFCAYAYVLSRKGAKKVVDFLKSKNGYWTSADHMMCNLSEILNIYFLHPLQAGCYQEDDPVYCTSAFNDFTRKDNFDSDLWNNNEHFSEEEVRGVLVESDPLDIIGALEDATHSQSVEEIKKKETEIEGVKSIEKKKTRRLVSVS